MESAIRTQQLSKVYHPSQGWRLRTAKSPVTAVDSVTLAVARGELFGLLGPNGAGKTTLVKILCTLILPSSGSASIAGSDLKNERNIRAMTGLVVSDERSFYWRLSVKRNLDFFAAMQGLYGSNARSRIDTVLRDVGLFDRANQRFSDLSSGMRQRLAVARALLHRPRLLFLDEPTRSLDPAAKSQIHDLILRVREQQELTVFLITHDLAEAEKLCDRIALMHKAQIRGVGRPAELRRHLRPQRTYVLSVDPISNPALRKLRDQYPGLSYTTTDQYEQRGIIQFQASEEDGNLTAVIDYLRGMNIEVVAIESAPPSLEDVFTHYTDESLESKE
jgi:ABC-2 type transport system ATP-binding protein